MYVAPEQPLRVVRVLVVDDTPTLRMLTRMALDGSGFEVVGEAGDGLSGVNQVKELHPDLVLLDLAMPVMDGLEALPLIRAAEPGVRVVIVSGFDRKAMEAQVIEAGADAYLQKGTTPEETLRALHALFPATGLPAGVPEPRAAEPEALPAPTPADAAFAALEADMEQLLYVVSHDLSGPVHVIKGFAERLARRAHDEEEGEFCEFILEAAQRMQELLDDLLEYAKAGNSDLPQELLDCRRVVDTVLAGLGSTLAESNGRVTVGHLPREVAANRLVLTEVLHNLVANALKFVTPGQVPAVHVEGVIVDGFLTFRISDNGVGIASADHERIFEPFKRLHSRSHYPGSGIGLAICQRLVGRQGGSIRVESHPNGSTFVVEIPV